MYNWNFLTYFSRKVTCEICLGHMGLIPTMTNSLLANVKTFSKHERRLIFRWKRQDTIWVGNGVLNKTKSHVWKTQAMVFKIRKWKDKNETRGVFKEPFGPHRWNTMLSHVCSITIKNEHRPTWSKHPPQSCEKTKIP